MPLAQSENHSQASLLPAAGPRRSWLPLLCLIVAGVAARVPAWLAFRPIWSGDSGGYASFYALWVHHHFFAGERTPVYPFFLGVAQWMAGVPAARTLGLRAGYAAVFLQAFADLAAAIVFYLLLRALRVRTRTALLCGLLLVTTPALLMAEMTLLNMSLSLALLVATMAMFAWVLRRVQQARAVAIPAVMLGAVACVMALNRPEFVIFSAILMLTLAGAALCQRSQSALRRLRMAPLWMALGFAPAMLLWMSLVYAGTGEFRITTVNGWNRTRTVYNLFDRVDAEDRVVGQILQETYQRERQTGGVNLREIVWPSMPGILQHLESYPGLEEDATPNAAQQWYAAQLRQSFALTELPCSTRLVDYCWEMMRIRIETGDYLGRVSGKLIRRYPLQYAANVGANFAEESFNFHYAGEAPSTPGFHETACGGGDVVRRPRLAGALRSILPWHAALLLAAYLVTLLGLLLGPRLLWRPLDEHWTADLTCWALALASTGTMLLTCALAGFNRIYSLPHLAVFFLTSAYVWNARERWYRQLRRQ